MELMWRGSCVDLDKWTALFLWARSSMRRDVQFNVCVWSAGCLPVDRRTARLLLQAAVGQWLRLTHIALVHRRPVSRQLLLLRRGPLACLQEVRRYRRLSGMLPCILADYHSHNELRCLMKLCCNYVVFICCWCHCCDDPSPPTARLF